MIFRTLTLAAADGACRRNQGVKHQRAQDRAGGPKFEKSSEHKLAITWGTAADLKSQIEKGTPVDVAVITDAAPMI
jgi:hypothetical protein